MEEEKHFHIRQLQNSAGTFQLVGMNRCNIIRNENDVI
jgi:hypothetical protein